MNRALQKYLEAASGLTNLTAAKAEQIAKGLVRSGEDATDQVGDLVEDLLERSKRNREAVTALVKSETTRAVRAMGLATGKQVERLQKQVVDLKRELRRVEDATGTEEVREASTDRSPKRTGKKATAKKAAGKKATAKKSSAKKATAKKAAGKKATAKKSAGKKATAKKATAKKATAKKSAGKKATAKKSAGKKATAKKAAGKKATAKKSAGKKATAKKATAKKAAGKKATAKKATAKKAAGKKATAKKATAKKAAGKKATGKKATAKKATAKKATAKKATAEREQDAPVIEASLEEATEQAAERVNTITPAADPGSSTEGDARLLDTEDGPPPEASPVLAEELRDLTEGS